MDRTKQLEAIRKACIAANPKIVDEFWDGESGVKTGELVREIRIADVLLTINAANLRKVYLLSIAGIFCSFMAREGVKAEAHEVDVHDYISWNLYKDNLADQSDSTIDFLYGLLKTN